MLGRSVVLTEKVANLLGQFGESDTTLTHPMKSIFLLYIYITVMYRSQWESPVGKRS